MTTYIIPISGVDYVRYVAFFSILSNTFLRPSLIISASGGCMISYLAMMSSFESIVENWNINSKLFAYKVIPFVPRMVTFMITGRLYRRPNIESYVKEMYIESKLKDVQIITGYYSYTKKKIVLSTNFGEAQVTSGTNVNEGILKSDFDLINVDTEYCDGDLQMIIDSVKATTNVPFFLPPLQVKKDGITVSDERVDYGIHSPSPFTFMRSSSSKLNQVIYFSPINIELNYVEGFRELLFLNMIQTEILKLSSGYTSFTDYNDLTFLSKLVPKEPGLPLRYLLIIYTTVKVDMNIANFTSFQSKEYVRLIKENTKFRLYL